LFDLTSAENRRGCLEKSLGSQIGFRDLIVAGNQDDRVRQGVQQGRT
jgi:hypothetical protein